jgi:hypothetical protein
MVSTAASGWFDGWSLYSLSTTCTVGDPAAEGLGAVLFAPAATAAPDGADAEGRCRDRGELDSSLLRSPFASRACLARCDDAVSGRKLPQSGGAALIDPPTDVSLRELGARVNGSFGGCAGGSTAAIADLAPSTRRTDTNALRVLAIRTSLEAERARFEIRSASAMQLTKPEHPSGALRP